jgi:aminopeptidase N
MNNFDGISYAKGASALRQLVAWLGPKAFTAGLNTHFARHRFGNAALADFLDSLGSATERDVPAWAAAWLRTSGHDTLTPAVLPGGPDGGWRLEIRHRGHRPHRIDVGLYDRAAADPATLVLRDRLTVDLAPGNVAEQHVLDGPRPDLVLLNDGDLTFAKVHFDPQSWDTVRDALGGLPDPLARAVVWNAARDLVRDGGIAPAAYVALMAAHLPGESDPGIVDAVLTFCRGPVADQYLDPALRPQALRTLRDTARGLLAAGRDGTRLSATRALVDAVHDADDTVALRGWYDQGEIPGGSPLDPELRWRMLLRLAVLGAAGPADIDAELAGDPSAVGREGAARCRAALPDAAAKEAAWEAMFHDDGQSNYLVSANAQGFWNPEHEGLTAGYVARYFADVVPLAARRGTAIAELAGRTAFPHTAVSAETLRLGRACLDGSAVTPALARALADRLDDLSRTLHIRSA